jgi:hypothetical protein
MSYVITAYIAAFVVWAIREALDFQFYGRVRLRTGQPDPRHREPGPIARMICRLFFVRD